MRKDNYYFESIVASLIVIILIIISYTYQYLTGQDRFDTYIQLSILAIVVETVLFIGLIIIKRVLIKIGGKDYDEKVEKLQVDLIRVLNLSADKLYLSNPQSKTNITGIYGVDEYSVNTLININAICPLRMYEACEIEYYAFVVFGDHKANIIISNKGNISQIIHVDTYSDWNKDQVCNFVMKEKNCKIATEKEQKILIDEYVRKLQEYHFIKYDDAIAGEWRKLHAPFTTKDVINYQMKMEKHQDTYSEIDKWKYAKEIVFYVLPQAMRLKDNKDVMEATEKLFQYACILQKKELNITENNLKNLQDYFLIYTFEEAETYYKEHKCNVCRYKDGYIETDFAEVRESFEQLKLDEYYPKWKQEAFDQLLKENDADCEYVLIQSMLYLGEGAFSKENLEKFHTYKHENIQNVKRIKKINTFYNVYIRNRNLKKCRTKWETKKINANNYFFESVSKLFWITVIISGLIPIGKDSWIDENTTYWRTLGGLVLFIPLVLFVVSACIVQKIREIKGVVKYVEEK